MEGSIDSNPLIDAVTAATAMDVDTNAKVEPSAYHPLKPVKEMVLPHCDVNRCHFAGAGDCTSTLAFCFLCTLAVEKFFDGEVPNDPNEILKMRHVLRRLHTHAQDAGAGASSSADVVEKIKEENDGVVLDDTDGHLARCLNKANTCLCFQYQTQVSAGERIRDEDEGSIDAATVDESDGYNSDNASNEHERAKSAQDSVDGACSISSNDANKNLLKIPPLSSIGLHSPLPLLKPFTQMFFKMLFWILADKFKVLIG